MKPKFIIYGLYDPRSGEIRYVGKSTSGLKRANSHGYPACLSRDRTHCGNWIKGLKAAGLKFEVGVLEVTQDPSDLSKMEQAWIAKLRAEGARLTNHTDGGEGQLGVKFSEERKQKISDGHGGVLRRKNEILALYATGLSSRAVAKELGVGYVTVSKYIKQAGVTRNRTPRTVRTAETIRLVMDLWAEGMSGPKIATKLGISSSAVYACVKDKTSRAV